MAEFCDGWMPLAARHDIAGQVERVRQAVADTDRDPQAFQVIANGANRNGVETLAEAGVDEAIFGLPALGADIVIHKLDQIAEAVGLA